METLFFRDHSDIWKFEPRFPSSSFKLSLTNGDKHLLQVAFTDIPHFEHSYVVILKIYTIKISTFQSVLNET